KYQESRRPTNFRQFGNALGRPGQVGGATNRGDNGRVQGEILATDGKSLTVKLGDGSSKIVILSAGTTVSETATSSAAALKVGDQVAVLGSQNSDGSVTAQNIQLHPILGNFRVRPGN
ncbi:MAG: DUF5666 domain-containing protein, partial [Patescibacteria group bacterium]